MNKNLFFLVGIFLMLATSLFAQSYSFTVYPNKNTIMITTDSEKQVYVNIPAGTYDVYAEFSNASAGGELNSVFFMNQTGENTTEWPRGHNMHISISETHQTITFPTEVQGSLFFTDLMNPYDNYGYATVHFGTHEYTVYPNQNVILFNQDIDTTQYVQVKIPAGNYRISATFNNAHAGGDLDGVFFMNQTGENTTEWPNGHNMQLSITKNPISINFPTQLNGYLFFVDRGDFTDNTGNAVVTFEKIGNNSYQLRRLTTSPNREGWYGWSPGGKSLAYIEAVPPYDGRTNLLKIINADGSNERTLYQGVGIGYGYAVDWVKDHICFIANHQYQANPNYYEKGDGDVYWIKEDGNELKRLTNTTCGAANGIHNFSWGNSSDSVGTVSDVIRLTPDASKIAFIAHNGNGWYAPYIGDINNWDHVLYVNSSGHLNGLYLSRDGSFLLYEQASNWDQPHDIHKINIDGTNDVTLVTNIQVNEGLEFAISPDMTRFVYTSNQEGQRDISMMNIDGTNNRTLIATDKDEFFSHLTDRSYSRRDPKGIWSPDGQKIVFTRLDANGKGDIYMLNLQTMQETQLTSDPANDFDPSFSPDGKKVAFISDRSGSQDIWIIDMSQTGIEENKSSYSMPNSFALEQNYPNPFNPSTTIAYDLPEKSRIRIDIFNLLGTHIRTLINCWKAPGHYSIMWDGLDDQLRNVPSGIYICQLKAGKFVTSRKMLLIR